MGSTMLTTDCVPVPVTSHQNGIPNGNSKMQMDTNTSLMYIEECRLETFKGKWPVQAPVPAERLAKAGFYYSGHDMDVTCFSCGGCIGEWSYGDYAYEKHKRFFGNVCDFIKNKSNNVPYIQGSSKPRPRSTEFSPGPEKSVLKTRGSPPEAPFVHNFDPGLSNNYRRGQSHDETSFPLQYEEHVVSGHLGEYQPMQNGIPLVSTGSGNTSSNRMTFSGNSASGANLTYQEAKTVPQPNRSKGIFMSGNSGIGARVMYNNQEVNRSTAQQANPSNAPKGIFMSGNSGLGATVTFTDFNVNYQSAMENSERNASNSSPLENVHINGIPVQVMQSAREQFFNQGTSFTPNVSSGTANVHINGIPVQAMPSVQEQILSSTANSFPGTVNVNVGIPVQPNVREPLLNHGTSSTANNFSGASTQSVNTIMNGYAVASEVQSQQGDERMRYEAERINSFKSNWPLTFISPYDLAKAGFYYMQTGDICKCAFCKGVLTNWQSGDIPIREHHRNFPLCPFVMGQDVGNVPSYLGDLEILRNGSSSGQDECGRYWYEERCNVPERTGRLLQSSNDDDESGGIRHKGPMHVSQATVEARLRSFQSWPLWSPIKAGRLAEAGFFYIGIRDHTKCFYCDIGLCNWEPGDDPWIEHGRWSKNCAFVKLLKGQDFVNSCQVIAASPHMGENSKYSEPEEELHSPFSAAVEEAMRSSLVQSVLKTKVYPSVLVRKALLRKFQDTGRGVSNVNELSEAVMVEMEESWRNRSMPTTAIQTPSVVSVTNGPVENMSNNRFINYETVEKPETELTTEERLEQVKQQSQECRLCKICMDREIEVAFIPCGHQLACRQCALALKDCAICRKPVERFLRIFLP